MIADGFLVVDKPPGVTSHDMVAVVRAVTGFQKVGHTGTLDPFATGVLPLALGGATRLIPFLDESRKVYDAIVVLGTQTDTGDPTGVTIAEAPVPALKLADVERLLATFLGNREQTPPKYSAVKVKGKPLYAYARAGKEVEVRARTINVSGMELLGVGEGTVRVRITCSRGTYARVLAEEIGVGLGTVGHLGELRREASGGFNLEHAISMSRLGTIVGGSPEWVKVLRPTRGDDRVAWRERSEILAGLQPWLIAAPKMLSHLPSATLTPIEARRFVVGGNVPPAAQGQAQPVLLMDGREVLGVVAPGQRPVVLARESEPAPRPPSRRDATGGVRNAAPSPQPLDDEPGSD
jgi:tRNA pseudouridine55 synthase